MHVSQVWTTEPSLGNPKLHAITLATNVVSRPRLANSYALDSTLVLPTLSSLCHQTVLCSLVPPPLTLAPGAGAKSRRVLKPTDAHHLRVPRAPHPKSRCQQGPASGAAGAPEFAEVSPDLCLCLCVVALPPYVSRFPSSYTLGPRLSHTTSSHPTTPAKVLFRPRRRSWWNSQHSPSRSRYTGGGVPASRHALVLTTVFHHCF